MAESIAYQLFIFKQPLAPYEVRWLRSATISLTKPGSVLYHNHIKNGYLYGYPLIQYKSINGKGAILYLSEAVNQIGLLFKNNQREVRLKSGKKISFQIEKITARVHHLRLLDSPETYIISNWIPLQDENYLQYKKLEHEQEKIAFLKKILIGNIWTFSKGVGWKIPGKLIIDQFQILNENWISYKKTKMLGFQIKFSLNASLPPYIGLGKGASKNYGVLKRAKIKVFQ